MNTTPPDDGLDSWRRQELLWTLRWLAAEPDAALAAVDGIYTADEIALDLQDWSEIAQQWGLLDETLARMIAEIDREFGEMTERGPDLWTDDAVRTSPEWAKQRLQARVVLAAMGESRADAALGLARPGGPVYVHQSAAQSRHEPSDIAER